MLNFNILLQYITLCHVEIYNRILQYHPVALMSYDLYYVLILSNTLIRYDLLVV